MKILLTMMLATTVASLAENYPSRFSSALTRRPEVIEAFSWIETHNDERVAEWIRLTEIPAHSGNEQRRGSFVKEEMMKAGLSDVSEDEMGNVMGVRRGSSPGPAILFTAHTDTVFSDTTDLKVRQNNHTLRAPGIYDNTASLANMLAAIRAMKAARIASKTDLIFLATTQEEVGLRGMRHWLESHRDKVRMIVALDSNPLPQISYGALGIRWLKFIYTAEGANTNVSQGKPNPAKAVARAILDIYAIPMPVSTRENTAVYNIGTIGGGSMVNAISQESFFTVDIRVNDKTAFPALVIRIQGLAEAAAKAEGVGFRVETLLDLPAAGTSHQLEPKRAHPLVQTALDVQNFLDMGEGLPATAVPSGSTDANIGLEMGIPGIGIGTTAGGDQHTLQEYAEIDPTGRGAKMILLLAVSLAEPR